MSRARRFCAACAAATLVLVLSAAATTAAKKPAAITGKLSQPGYTVIALAGNGKATSVRVKSRSFKLRPPAKLVTLHLRAPNGTYAGPIVVGRKGKRAILGVKAGARLGKVTVRRGYAKPKRKLSKRFLDSKRWARAKKGVPIGVGKVGLVRSKLTRRGGPGDRDLDGIPNSLDIDDDGDLILDDYDRAPSKKKSASSAAVGGPFLALSPLTWLPTLEDANPVNVNGGSSDEQIAVADQNRGMLQLGVIGADPGSEEVDCGTLIYCSAGGTGRLERFPPGGPGAVPDPGAVPGRDPSDPPFPACCDADHDGLGSLTDPGSGQAKRQSQLELYHGATADQIRAGDVLIEHATINGAAAQTAISVGFVFATHPVLASYDDGQGNSRTFSYPRTDLCGGPTPTPCPVPVRAGPNGDVVVRLTFWRPQRRHTAGDPGTDKWMDVGNLAYATHVAPSGPAPPGTKGFCSQGSYSGMDPNLTPDPTSADNPVVPPFGQVRYLDDSGDQPARSGNTFSYTLNFTRCLAADGLSMSTTLPTPVYFNAFVIHDRPPGGFGPARVLEAGATSQVSFQLQP